MDKETVIKKLEMFGPMCVFNKPNRPAVYQNTWFEFVIDPEAICVTTICGSIDIAIIYFTDMNEREVFTAIDTYFTIASAEDLAIVVVDGIHEKIDDIHSEINCDESSLQEAIYLRREKEISRYQKLIERNKNELKRYTDILILFSSMLTFLEEE